VTATQPDAPPEARKRRGRPPLPPSPREVPLPGTFGDWYDLAAANLGVAERRDSSGWRIVAGLVMLAGTMIGASATAESVAVLLGYGFDGEQADVGLLVVGGFILVATLSWWFWYRRDWRRARLLRRAWSRSLRTPDVLSLPVREPRTSDRFDPESMHAFRARRHERLEPHAGVRPVDGFSGLLDFLRAVAYPTVLGSGLVMVAAVVDGEDLRRSATGLGAALPVLFVGFFATVRAWRRVAESQALNGLGNDDGARWTGWRVLHGQEEAAAPRPWWRRLNLVFLPVAVGGLVVVLTRVASGPTAGVDGVAIGVGIVVVPILLVYGGFVVRVLAGRVRARGTGVAVRVLRDDVPPQGPVVVSPGPAVLDLGGDGPALRSADGTATALDGAALVSGAPLMLAGRRHWLVLADGSQAPLVCADVRRLHRLAAGAGLRVL
jgi:hypothetical protein